MASSPHKAVALLIKQTLEAERETRCSERHANGGLREKAVSPHHLYFRKWTEERLQRNKNPF